LKPKGEDESLESCWNLLIFFVSEYLQVLKSSTDLLFSFEAISLFGLCCYFDAKFSIFFWE
jgi:hypothetical protein